MTRLRQIRDQIATLGEIGEILGAMKNLALMELQKLNRLLATERHAVQTIEAAAADLVASYMDEPPEPDYLDIDLIVGTERGFCGDLNESLVAAAGKTSMEARRIVVIGGRSAALLAHTGRAAVPVAGASVAEEVERVLEKVVQELDSLQREAGGGRPLRLTAWYPDGDTGAQRERRLTPIPDLPKPSPAFPYPPVVNIAPVELFPKIVDQYLYAVLHEVLYGALLAENHRRLLHMESALNHLEENRARLRLRYNVVRQEEITEEIEVILLSAEAISADGAPIERATPTRR
ncbi:MAG: F0F1 ATP synthase subunit gamma [Betaproteobacteria bacterium]|nr:F0F1 ATP synthase subunit gamma [Betaproteobacteria bacterium]